MFVPHFLVILLITTVSTQNESTTITWPTQTTVTIPTDTQVTLPTTHTATYQTNGGKTVTIKQTLLNPPEVATTNGHFTFPSKPVFNGHTVVSGQTGLPEGYLAGTGVNGQYTLVPMTQGGYYDNQSTMNVNSHSQTTIGTSSQSQGKSVDITPPPPQTGQVTIKPPMPIIPESQANAETISTGGNVFPAPATPTTINPANNGNSQTIGTQVVSPGAHVSPTAPPEPTKSVISTECGANCLQCSKNGSIEVCLDCSTSFGLKNGKCSKCKINNCINCSKNAEICEQCQTGWYNAQNTCTKCSDNCVECLTSEVCHTCDSGYFKQSNGTCSDKIEEKKSNSSGWWFNGWKWWHWLLFLLLVLILPCCLLGLLAKICLDSNSTTKTVNKRRITRTEKMRTNTGTLITETDQELKEQVGSTERSIIKGSNKLVDLAGQIKTQTSLDQVASRSNVVRVENNVRGGNYGLDENIGSNTHSYIQRTEPVVQYVYENEPDQIVRGTRMTMKTEDRFVQL